MEEADFFAYLSQLWAMMIWGNKHITLKKTVNGCEMSYTSKAKIFARLK